MLFCLQFTDASRKQTIFGAGRRPHAQHTNYADIRAFSA